MVTVYRNKSALLCLVESVPVVAPQATVGFVRTLLEKHARDYASIAYTYIVSPDRQLIGVVSIKKIFTHRTDTLVTTIANHDVVVATTTTDCESIARLAWQHNVKAVPVIEEKTKKFVGVVTPDKIMDILHQGRTLDALRHAGARPFSDPAETLLTGTPLVHIKKRLPWLIVGLLGGLLAASIVQFFEQELVTEVLIAAFIPLVVYLADAVGSQAEIIFVRAIALDPKLATWPRFKKYFAREMVVSLALASILGVLVAIVCQVWFAAPELVGLLVTAIMSTLLLAVVVALIIPFCALRLRLDPALTSGPVATVIRDVLTLLVYFIVVGLFIGVW